MKTLKGSCQCQKVRFTVRSDQYYPYQLCYCSICRKQGGGGGFAINISASAPTLKVVGKKFVKVHHARMKNRGDQHAHRSSGERHFCGECGSCLWVFDKDYPELLHPFASAIDTPLPIPPEKTHICLEFKAPWVKPDFGPRDKKFKRYPKESIQQWHERVIGR
ncbi:MAG: GFA family protein [Proteobacteria bacterium]|nr:MAG: GFA family protein [Pseudomonadota bacterium]